MAADQAPIPTESRLAMALLSKTGHGKSSLGNALFQDKATFKISRRMNSETAECKSVDGFAAGRAVKIVDTPGTMDVLNLDAALTELCQVITYCPTGIDVFLLVLRCDVRFTSEEQMAFKLLEKMFGAEIYDFCIIVFTNGDRYENDEDEFREDLNTDRSKIGFLSELLDKCGNRMILMDNGPRCDQEFQVKQVDRLMGMVENLAKNNNKKYTNKYFELAQKRLKEEEEEAKKKKDKELEAIVQARVHKKVTQDVKRQVEAEGDSCFPSDATVLTPQGRMPLSELSLGQPVLSLQNGRPAFSPVFMWGHRDETAWSSNFVTLATESARVTLSADHLVFAAAAGAGKSAASLAAVPAGSVQPGLVLQLLDGVGCEQPRLETVVAVERDVSRRGLLAPFTLSGCIVVDGVVASCYINCLPHSLSHALLAPVRILWQLAPSIVDGCNKVGCRKAEGYDGMPGWVRLACSHVIPWLPWLKVDGSQLLKQITAE